MSTLDKEDIEDHAKVRGLLVWTLKDGSKLPIVKMSDTHLLNTIKMLIRNRSALETLEPFKLEFRFRNPNNYLVLEKYLNLDYDYEPYEEEYISYEDLNNDWGNRDCY